MMSVDDAVRAAIETEGTVGDDARAELGLPPLVDPDADATEDAEEASAEEASAEEASAAPAENAAEDEGENADAAGGVDADASSDDEEEEEAEEGQLGARTLSQILAAEIAERFDDGFVVDSLACAYASPKTLARALVRALRLKGGCPARGTARGRAGGLATGEGGGGRVRASGAEASRRGVAGR